MADFQPQLTKRFGIKNSHTLNVYLETGGYSSLKNLFAKKPAEVIEEVKASGLKGRGGAGFPAGMKWSFVPQNTGKPIYLVVNADEGEPGTFTDRFMMLYDPHLLIEGIICASYAINCHTAYVYVRGEFLEQINRLNAAIEEAKKANYLGKNIQGSGFDLEIYVHRGAGAYICGEETGLIESLEGKKGQPRIKPPFPAVVGAFGCPTIVNNVKTLSSVPWIIEHGAAAYTAIGTKESAGTHVFGLSGHVHQTGYWEMPFGLPMMEFIENYGKGVKGGKLKAVIPGGSSCPILTAQECQDLTLTYESMRDHKTMFGTGCAIIMNEHTDMAMVLKNLTHFYADESCGQCTPCREGTAWEDRLLKKIVTREATAKDLDLMLEIANNMEGKTICVFSSALAMPVRSFIQKFREDFEKYLVKNTVVVPEKITAN
ncbi:MAG TPA: NADH-quinone oxidoreductase subunit NuoF [bacterium]|nr:NADH-quinone oxidoreductase subunit NuoF [bacterium]